MQPLTDKRRGLLDSIIIVAAVIVLTLSGCGSATRSDSLSEPSPDTSHDESEVTENPQDPIEDDGTSTTSEDTNATAILSWDLNSEGDLAGYKVHYGTISGNYSTFVDFGLTGTPNTPSATVGNLTVGNRYFFVLTAYDTSNNESNFSDEVYKDIL